MDFHDTMDCREHGDGIAALVAARDLARLGEWVGKVGPSIVARADALAEAARGGWVEGVSTLCGAGVDVNRRERAKDHETCGRFRERKGVLPLAHAMARGDKAMSSVLIAHGASFAGMGNDLFDAFTARVRDVGWGMALGEFGEAFSEVDPLSKGYFWLSVGFMVKTGVRVEGDGEALIGWMRGLMGDSGDMPRGGQDALFHVFMGARVEDGDMPRWAARRWIGSASDADERLARSREVFSTGISGCHEEMAWGAAEAMAELGLSIDGVAALDPERKKRPQGFAERQHALVMAIRDAHGDIFGKGFWGELAMEAARKGYPGLLRVALGVGADTTAVERDWLVEGRSVPEFHRREVSVTRESLSECALELGVAGEARGAAEGGGVMGIWARLGRGGMAAAGVEQAWRAEVESRLLARMASGMADELPKRRL